MANEILVGHEEAHSKKYTQTYSATHDGAGNRLPLMRRSFITFYYGGKPIEDFQLIAVLNGFLNKNVYAEFEDATSEYDTIDGQQYWGTRMKANTLPFLLATDYMTQNNLDKFKEWFRPGVERDLVLAEHPNRYIRARVSAPPVMNLMPFGEHVTMQMQNSNGEITEQKTMTTIYRGDITLNFVMDEPYWTGILNYMPYPGRIASDNPADQRAVALLNSIIETNSLSSQDALKICLEDEIPHDFAIQDNDDFMLGSKTIYDAVILSMTSKSESELADYPAYVNPSADNIVKSPSAQISYLLAALADISRTDSSEGTIKEPPNYGAYLIAALADISRADQQDSIAGYDLGTGGLPETGPNDTRYLFYSGTAPSKPVINFLMDIKLNDDGYITNPINSIGSPDAEEKSYIKVGNHYFYFTTPGIFTSYNKTLDIFNKMKDSTSILDVRKEIRNKIREKHARAWALYCIKDCALTDTLGAKRESLLENYKKFLVHSSRSTDDGDVDCILAAFSFNSKTGESTGIFSCLTPDSSEKGEQVIENVGDMVLSEYLIIDEQNHLSENRLVIAGGENNNCTPITTNEQLFNLSILYNNMYY